MSCCEFDPQAQSSVIAGLTRNLLSKVAIFQMRPRVKPGVTELWAMAKPNMRTYVLFKIFLMNNKCVIQFRNEFFHFCSAKNLTIHGTCDNLRFVTRPYAGREIFTSGRAGNGGLAS
jgi:hypothetical protein